MFLWHDAAVLVNINHCWRVQILTTTSFGIYYTALRDTSLLLYYRVEWINLFSFSTLFHSSPKSKSIRLILRPWIAASLNYQHQTTTTRCAFHGQFKIQFFTDQIIIISSLNDKIIINSYIHSFRICFLYSIWCLPSRSLCRINRLRNVLRGEYTRLCAQRVTKWGLISRSVLLVCRCLCH